MKPAVTVIVPVYKVEGYIERCARSLFEQTLGSLEILFIDDCSPDRSVDIIKTVLEEYPLRKQFTRIIRMPENSGQACVRSKGITESTGDYIIHCDGDDWVDIELYETLYIKALSTGADIVVCDEVMEYAGYSVPKPTQSLPGNGKLLMKNWYKAVVGMFCHNKLVKRSIYINNNIIPWAGLNMWEDNGLFARLFYYADKIVQIKGGPLYHYNRENENALTSGYGIRQVEQMISVAKNIADFYDTKVDGKDFRKTVDAFKYLARINLITDSYSNYRRFKSTFPESRYIANELDPNAFSFKGKFRFNLVRYGMSILFIALFKFKKILAK